MTEVRSYPSGVPCWVDTKQPDPEAAQRFYGPLLGWTFEAASGSSVMARLGGREAAAIVHGSGPAVWNTYITVDDIDDAADRIVRAGGEVVRGPEDAGGDGRMAWVADPAGAAFRLWLPGRRLGAQAVNLPGAWNFSDLHTSDPATAKAFYGDVFGWETDDVGGDAAMWRRPGYGDHLAATSDPEIYERQAAVSALPGFADAIAWLAPLDDADVPHWHVTFAVANRDATMADAVRLGATDLSGPIDTPWTKAALLRDPQGAIFTMSQFTPPGG
jgi:predicted enzyme related to lactoylglutathione lyase